KHDLGCRMFLKQTGRTAHGEWKPQVGSGPVAEKESCDRDRAVRLGHLQNTLGVALGVVGKVVLIVHRGLGLAGGAAREEPDGWIVGVGGGIFESGLLFCEEYVE